MKVEMKREFVQHERTTYFHYISIIDPPKVFQGLYINTLNIFQVQPTSKYPNWPYFDSSKFGHDHVR